MLEDCPGELRGVIKIYNAELATSSITTAIKAVSPPNEVFKIMTTSIRDIGDCLGIWMWEGQWYKATIIRV